ncbi:unnamed protein product [Paramecium primaurelia]|uniref:Uncharacterized protein n=1 Tax=Paramecium primaurelia TaxID=5886 RepID=A0A8S1N2Y3_PARPR|nr:unnamed protein product [Paramecium primaurelia]
MGDIQEQLNELIQKYEQLEVQWKQECQSVQKKDELINQLQLELEDKNKLIANLKSEIDSLNVYINDSIVDKKKQTSKFNELDKKYQKVKEEYHKLKQKLFDRNLHIQEQEKEYNLLNSVVQKETERLIKTYENKIKQLEEEKEQKKQGNEQKKQKMTYDSYKKWFILSLVLQPLIFGLTKFLSKKK